MVVPIGKPGEPVVVIFPQGKLSVTEQMATNFISQAPSQRVTLSQVFVTRVARNSRDIAAQVHDLISGRVLFQRAQAFEQAKLNIVMKFFELEARKSELVS